MMIVRKINSTFNQVNANLFVLAQEGIFENNGAGVRD